MIEEIYKKYLVSDIVQLGDILLDEDIDVYNQDLLSEGNIGYISRSKHDEWSIGVDESLDAYTKRFVIAHELAHYFLHKELVKNDSVWVDSKDAIRWRSATSLSENEQASFEANEFAASLLMPEKTVRKALKDYVLIDDLTRRKLSLFFGVPERALYCRLLELGYEQ